MINILKRKEFVGYSVKALESLGIIDFLPLDRHIGVRIPGGRPNSAQDFCSTATKWIPTVLSSGLLRSEIGTVWHLSVRRKFYNDLHDVHLDSARVLGDYFRKGNSDVVHRS